jgi:hypothetical protein
MDDEGLVAVSTNLRMLTILDISNSIDDSGKCGAGPKGVTAVVASLSELT